MAQKNKNKYDKDFHPNDFIRLSGEGKMLVEICAEWGIHRNTIRDWSKDKYKKPEFVEAYKLGRDCREAWYFKLGRGLSNGRIKGNVGAYVWMTKIGLGWRDDVPLELDDEIEGLTFND